MPHRRLEVREDEDPVRFEKAILDAKDEGEDSQEARSSREGLQKAVGTDC